MGILNIKKPGRKDLRVTAGDSFTQTFLFKDSAGDPLDVSDFDGTFARIVDEATDEVLAGFGVDLSAAATGYVTISLTITQTTSLSPCRAAWFFKMVDTSDTENKSITGMVGDFEVLKRRQFGE